VSRFTVDPVNGGAPWSGVVEIDLSDVREVVSESRDVIDVTTHSDAERRYVRGIRRPPTVTISGTSADRICAAIMEAMQNPATATSVAPEVAEAVVRALRIRP